MKFIRLNFDNVSKTQTTQPEETSLIKLAPKIYQFDELGMFCKFDVALDAGSKIPLRFRIGTVSGVDAQERKGPTRYNY